MIPTIAVGVTVVLLQPPPGVLSVLATLAITGTGYVAGSVASRRLLRDLRALP